MLHFRNTLNLARLTQPSDRYIYKICINTETEDSFGRLFFGIRFQRFYQSKFYPNKRAFQGQQLPKFRIEKKIFTLCNQKMIFRLQFCRKINVEINFKIICQFESSIFHF